MTTFYLDPEGGDDFGSDFSVLGRAPSATSLNSTTTAKYGARSLDFSAAAGSRVTYPVPNGTPMQVGNRQFTAEAWVYFTSHSATTVETMFGQWTDGGASNLSWRVGMNAAGQLQYQWSTTGAASAGTLTSAFTPTLNQWYHVAVDRDASTARLYLNGSVVASVADTSTLAANTATYVLGNDNANTKHFPGYMQDFRLTVGVARYAGSFTPPSAALPTSFKGDPYFHHVMLLVPGRGDGTGTSFANRWRSIVNGATAARTAPGDTIRLRATPDPTSIGNATWTQNSKTVTLASALTQNIDTCDVAWTGATNVTATANTGTTRREGSAYCNLAVAAAFTTGKLAYHATGALDLSGYQQINLWFQSNGNQYGGGLRLVLCSDTTGDVPIQSITLPDYQTSNQWQATVIDTGAALPSNVASVALYADIDPAAVTILLDNIFASKASASADALTLRSLIGKVHNFPWAASTAYALNDRRRPTQVNRNGFQYQVTTAGTSGSSEPAWPAVWGKTVTDGGVVWTCIDRELEDSWFPLLSVNGTTLTLANNTNDSFANVRGYHGATETVATYKREPVNHWPLPPNFSSSNTINESGSAGSPITYSGGWNRTDMSAQDGGETWWDGCNGNGNGLHVSTAKFVTISWFNAVRYGSGIGTSSGAQVMLNHCHANGCTSGFDLTSSQTQWTLNGVHGFNNSQAGVSCSNAGQVFARAIQGCSNGAGGSNQLGFQLGQYKVRANYVVARNNTTVGIGASGASYDSIVYNYATSGNASSVAVGNAFNPVCYVNGVCGEATFTNQNNLGGSQPSDCYLYSHKHGADVNDHRVYFAEGTIRSDTTTRHTASGLAWKCSITSTYRAVNYPVRFSLGRYLLQANMARTFKVWARRDNANIKGQLLIHAGSLLGIEVDATVTTDPSTLNTWEQSAGLTVTALETGVVELWMLWWDGVGTTGNYWIDDLTVA